MWILKLEQSAWVGQRRAPDKKRISPLLADPALISDAPAMSIFNFLMPQNSRNNKSVVLRDVFFGIASVERDPLLVGLVKSANFVRTFSSQVNLLPCLLHWWGGLDVLEADDWFAGHFNSQRWIFDFQVLAEVKLSLNYIRVLLLWNWNLRFLFLLLILNHFVYCIDVHGCVKVTKHCLLLVLFAFGLCSKAVSRNYFQDFLNSLNRF